MKKFRNILICGASLLMLIVPVSCKKMLESEYRSNLGPEFFQTPDGLRSGIAASYSIMRYFWGSEGFTTSAVAGTDEVIRGGDGDQVFHTYQGLNSQNGTIGGIWNNGYNAINNLNGILEFGPNTSLSATEKVALLAEAKFLRGFFYFLLVQNFGDVPLQTSFNSTPNTTATRAPQKDVYAAIIKDLTEASNELPKLTAVNATKGHAYQAAALALLAKVYLTKGWNAAAREGDGTADFTNAYNTANNLITNKASYGVDLEANYGDIFKEGNEYGKEVLFVSDRNTDPLFSESGYNATTAAVENKDNGLNRFWVCFYTLNRNVNEGITGAPADSKQIMVRDVVNGRPYRRFRPTPYTYDAFNNTGTAAAANTAFDSRYDNTFQKEWICNTPSTQSNTVQTTLSSPLTTRRGGNTVTLTPGVDAAILMPGREVTVAEREAFKGVIIAPSQYDAEWFPTMKKWADATRPHFNDPSDRPVILMRLGEVYLTAAEAAFKLNNLANAANMVNVLRTRAAFRTSGQAAGAVAGMQVTSANITLDFILRERTREMYGEMTRWYDLARTGTLVDRVKLYNSQGGPNIQAFHVLRPIPTGSQLDLLTNRNEFPQNPGY
ncbi:RagB/SusD family nutrient uptake outer membrane protein [Hufsiella ginkgonis]|uniref:RagB/SusD family nutrient uptake outer membrane protein n=1 Tax=Hufsiella ginkgonis TaxID=2695274 RepID=A0A7K1XUS1_9SPHI|nr:RagB/SusD family nutrient uptake outer membrane protein [Hufsiella ginkgonis]MXV14519.1 RagB/SusD family nutrient uptake outer membrane protein [Hufsiella ginkgonis]